MLSRIKENQFVVGTKQTLKAILSGDAVKVFLADDAGEYLRNKIIKPCAENNVPIERIGSMNEIGNSCGIGRSAVCAAIIKIKQEES